MKNGDSLEKMISSFFIYAKAEVCVWKLVVFGLVMSEGGREGGKGAMRIDLE